MGTFGVELWDRFNVVQKHGDDTTESCRQMAAFFQKRAALEKDYGKQLVALARDELAPVTKGFFQEPTAATREKGTLRQGWISISETAETVGKFHIDFASKITDELFNPLSTYIKEKEKLKKQYGANGQKVLKDFQEIVARMEKAEQRLERAKKELESIEAEAEKAGSTKAAKYQPKIQTAQEKVRSCDDELVQAKRNTEDSRQRTFLNDLPDVLNEFQKLEEERIRYLAQLFTQFNSLQESLIPVITDNCGTSKEHVANINIESDIALFIHEHKSQQGPFSATQSRSSGPDRRTKTRTVRYNAEVRMPEFEPFETLPSETRRERITSKIEEIRASIKVEQRATKGIENMMQLYSSHPEMKQKVEQQLEVSQAKIATLKDYQNRYNSILSTLGETPEPGSDEEAHNGGLPSNTDDEQAEQACTLIAVDPFEVVALYDYEAGEEDEISFNAGDTIVIHAQGDSGWWEGEIRGQLGLLPSNYVEMK